jgi:hypothetical protein
MAIRSRERPMGDHLAADDLQTRETAPAEDGRAVARSTTAHLP